MQLLARQRVLWAIHNISSRRYAQRTEDTIRITHNPSPKRDSEQPTQR